MRLVANWAGSGLAAHRQGRGEPILWLHGYTMDSTIWEDLWQLVPFEHIGVDLPGHGSSPPLLVGETLSSVGHRLREASQAEGVRHIVGISFGGMVALAAALDAPEWYKSVLLNSPAIGGGAQDPAAQRLNLELYRLYRARGLGPWLVSRWMESPPDIFTGCRRHPILWAKLERVLTRHSWNELEDGAIQTLTLQRQPLEQLTQLTAAVLLVLGEQDLPSIKRSVELIRRALRESRRVYLPETGHLAFLEDPVTSARLICEHLARVDGSITN